MIYCIIQITLMLCVLCAVYFAVCCAVRFAVCCAVLCAVLCCAVLCCAVLCCAVLCGAVLCCVFKEKQFSLLLKKKIIKLDLNKKMTKAFIYVLLFHLQGLLDTILKFIQTQTI